MMDIAAELARVCALKRKPVVCHLCGKACSTARERFPRSYFCKPCFLADLDRVTMRAIREKETKR